MSSRIDRVVQLCVACILAALVLAGLRASLTQAAALTIHTVTNTNDSGPNSLREAIGLA